MRDILASERISRRWFSARAPAITKAVPSSACPSPAQDGGSGPTTRAVGRLAGLGWIGRNNLLVNLRYGARVRYATVLTDLELPPDGPVEDGCEPCRKCIAACPGGAIGESPADFDLAKCKRTIDEIKKCANIGSRICGICVKACSGR